MGKDFTSTSSFITRRFRMARYHIIKPRCLPPGRALMKSHRQVNVGKDRSNGRVSDTASEFQGPDLGGGATAASKHTLGVSLLGACSSKGCPTKSAENEDRYAHVSFLFRHLRRDAACCPLLATSSSFPLFYCSSVLYLYSSMVSKSECYFGSANDHDPLVKMPLSRN